MCAGRAGKRSQGASWARGALLIKRDGSQLRTQGTFRDRETTRAAGSVVVICAPAARAADASATFSQGAAVTFREQGFPPCKQRRKTERDFHMRKAPALSEGFVVGK